MSNALGYGELRLDAVLQAAKTMAGAAVTAPKSGGQLFLQGGKMFMETVIVHDPGTRARMSAWLRARGKERREPIWFCQIAKKITSQLPVCVTIGPCGGTATCAGANGSTNHKITYSKIPVPPHKTISSHNTRTNVVSISK